MYNNGIPQRRPRRNGIYSYYDNLQVRERNRDLQTTRLEHYNNNFAWRMLGLPMKVE